jgi:hypothetical protein
MATTHYSTTDISGWCIQPGQKNSHNSLVWPLTITKDSRSAPRIQLGKDINTSLRAPFGISQFSQESKKSLDYTLPTWQPDLLAFLQRIDTMVVDHVFKNQTEFFKKSCLSRAALVESYHGLVSQKDSFDPLLRTKVNDKMSVFLIGENGSSKGTLDDITAGAQVVPIISPSSIWTMSGKFGLSCNTTGVMVWPATEKGLTDLFELDHAFATPMVICEA